jgi:protein O-GlcNAc transferase
MNLGNALRRLERWDEAISAQRAAVACSAEYAPARFNLAALLAARGSRTAAETELLEALNKQPTMTEALLLLADIYEADDRLDGAELQFKRAIEIAPHHAGILLNYGLFCFRQGRLEESHEWFKRALAADGNLHAVQSFLLMWSNYKDGLTADAIAAEHIRFGAVLTRAAGQPFTSWRNTTDPDRALRVGYVSGDFMPHPVALFLRPILERHDLHNFKVFCYSNYGPENAIAESLRQRARHWREIADLADQQVADLIRADEIDVLIDLSGHTDRHRLAVFARHPAPVQATWLGYLNTTGLPAMDYRICDAYTDPPGETERLYVEQLVRMPHSQWCYAPIQAIELVPKPHVATPDDVIFGSFNQSIKITDATLALWAAIVTGVPQSKLVIFDVRQTAAREALRRRLILHGIDPAKVTMRGREPLADYFAAIGNTDIALDTTPYNGATTTLDTLWMGIPLVALRGERAISRGSYSILQTLGAGDLIATTPQDYIEMNIKLAGDWKRRQAFRESLRPRLAASRLMDVDYFTQALEQRYREMWRAWCSGQSTNENRAA